MKTETKHAVPLQTGQESAEIRQFVSSTFNLKKILVPVDFSDCSRKALQYAVPFAREFGARLVVLYVGEGVYVVPELGVVDIAFVETPGKADAEKELAALIKEEIGEKVVAEPLVRRGFPAKEIVAAAKDTGADLVILSTHGRTGLQHAWYGSTAEEVVRRAPCPVLIVREREHEFIAN